MHAACTLIDEQQVAHVLASSEEVAAVSWRIDSPDGFLVTDPNNLSMQKQTDARTLKIAVRNGSFFLDDKTTQRSALRITPISGSFTFVDKAYEGSLLTVLEDGAASLLLERAPQLPPEEIHDAAVEEQPAIIDVDKRLYNVRVLLDEWGTKKDHAESGHLGWRLSSERGFKLSNRTGAVTLDSVKSPKKNPSELSISVRNGHLYVNKVRYDDEILFIVPTKHATAFDANEYQGSFVIARKNDSVYLINSLDLEDYVFSVLRTESWPGWPLEVNKVFAVACRSYAIAMIMRSKSSKLPYHIKNTNVHQTYTGIHECPLLKTAVEETRGVFVSYEGKPIIAMFDGCCGGVVPAHIKGFNFTGAPYLARPYACTYCRSCKLYSWQAHYSANALTSMMKKTAPTIKKLKDIKVTKKDKAGLVQEVTLHSPRGAARVPGKKFYSSLKGIKSYCFTIHKHADTVTFKGRGYGHHLGLCQWGAREMVRRGWQYRDILQFYYPNTTFMRLT